METGCMKYVINKIYPSPYLKMSMNNIYIILIKNNILDYRLFPISEHLYLKF